MDMQLTSALEKVFGVLLKILFFEYQTVSELSDYFINNHNSQLLKLFEQKVNIDKNKLGTSLPENDKHINSNKNFSNLLLNKSRIL